MTRIEPITYALCLNNDDYPVALEVRKIYPVLAPEENDPPNYLRIVDESGEDYLFSRDRFAVVALPREVANAVQSTFA